MKVDLNHRTALVTGGAQGIGRAIVDVLLANGARVIIMDIDEKRLAEAMEELKSHGRQVASIAADVSKLESVRESARQVTEQFGGLDILINNAGINTQKNRRPIHEYGDDDWNRILSVDLTGLFYVSREFIPGMIAKKEGRIVNIASIAGLVPLRLQSAFVAAKAGVINLSKSMALELGPQGVLVNAVAPGSTLTKGTEALFYGKDGAYSANAASLISHIPLGRPGKPEEIAHAVLFLSSPEASYVNGAVLTVDGGWTAGYTREW